MRLDRIGLFLVVGLACARASVAQGVPNVPQTPGERLCGLIAPEQGRTAVLAYHEGVLFTVPEVPASEPGSDCLIRTWSIADPRNPVLLDTWNVTPHGFSAHGYMQSGDRLVLATWQDYVFTPTGPTTFRRDEFRNLYPDMWQGGDRGALFKPWGVTVLSAYHAPSDPVVFHRGGTTLATWNHMQQTGVISHPFIVGNVLIMAADQSDSGICTYDLSLYMDADPRNDPAQPPLLDQLTGVGGLGGYHPELWGGGDVLYVVWPDRDRSHFVFVDVADPSALRLVADVDVSRPGRGVDPAYCQFQDEFMFSERFKMDMRSFQVVLELDEETNRIDTSQFQLPVGNLLVTGGVGQWQGMAIWAHQSAPDLRGPSVGYHVPRADQTDYPVGAPVSVLIHETLRTSTVQNGTTFIVRPVGGSALQGSLFFSYDDVLTFQPAQALAPNTTYEVVLPAGGIQDVMGNGMEPYSFRFSTGGALSGNQPPQVTSLTATSPVQPGGTASFAAAGTDPEGSAVEYRFDFGDGTAPTAWSATASADHTYAQAGHFRAKVQVRDPAQAVATRGVVVTVVTPPPSPQATSSSSILVDAARRRVWTVNPDGDTVTALDADALSLVAEVAVGRDPRGVAQAQDGNVWITCRGDDRLVVLGPQGAPVATLALPYGSAPHGVCMSPDGALAYVTLSGSGRLLRFDTATRQQTGDLALGPTPRAVAVSRDGARVLVTRFLSPRLHGEVWDVTAATFTLARTLRLQKDSTMDGQVDSAFGGRGVPNELSSVVFAPDGLSAWVLGKKANVDRGTFADGGADLDQDNTVRSIIAFIALPSGAEAQLERVDIDNSDSPMALAFSPLGDYAFVALQGNAQVLLMDVLEMATSRDMGALVTRLNSGAAPQGLCVDPVSSRLFVQDFLGRTVTVYALADLLATGAVPTTPAAVIATVGVEALSPQVLAGKRIFYASGDPRMSAEGYMSCATCHLDGGQDGRVYDFTGRGEGFRNTISLQGRAGLGHGDVHWSANFDELQDFENDIRLAFGGTGFLSDADFAATRDTLGPRKAGLSADLDALAAYVTSLGHEALPRSPFRATNGLLTAEALAGQAVFAAQGCASCHAGSELTDLVLHDVGTLRTSSGQRLGQALAGIDTPTLLGVHATAPYLHDGSAEALDDVFRTAGGTLYQAENGALGPNSIRHTDQYPEVREMLVHLGAAVEVRTAGSLTLGGVDGGAGGVGALELRVSTENASTLEVLVNQTAYPMALPSSQNTPSWQLARFSSLRLEGVTLAPGATNTIRITLLTGSRLVLDDVLVSTPDHLLRAEPHRRVLALPQAERDGLLAYLRQLDGRDASGALIANAPAPGPGSGAPGTPGGPVGGGVSTGGAGSTGGMGNTGGGGPAPTGPVIGNGSTTPTTGASAADGAGGSGGGCTLGASPARSSGGSMLLALVLALLVLRGRRSGS